jgi:hypothetical protein
MPRLDSSIDELKQALSNFETCLATPIVSGDLAGWASEVQKAWSEASAQIHFHAKHSHARQYDEIGQQDAELFPRIDQLKKEDDEIEAARAQLHQIVMRVTEHTPKMEPDEEKAKKYTQNLADEGLAFLARVRKQEVAIQTWYVEAFSRDRGAVD